MDTRLTPEKMEQLKKPFPLEAHKFKVQTKPGESGRALVVVYIDARDVMLRLDEVAGGDWGDVYSAAPCGGVDCGLTVLGVTRHDVGDPANENEPEKSGYSDSLKRAGVKFGIGRYLYSLPKMWATVRETTHGRYVLADGEEERLRRTLEHNLGAPTTRSPEPEPAARGESTSAARPAAKRETETRPRSALSAVQRRKLLEIYRNLHDGNEADAARGLEAMFVETFKHGMDAASYEEGAHITAQLLAAQRSR